MAESGAAEESEFGAFDWTGGAPGQGLGATGRTRTSSRMDSRQSLNGNTTGLGDGGPGMQATGPGMGASYVDPLIGN